MRGQLTVTAVPLALIRCPAAVEPFLFALTPAPLTVAPSPPTLNGVPHNSRSVCQHGATVSAAENSFHRNGNVFRSDATLRC